MKSFQQILAAAAAMLLVAVAPMAHASNTISGVVRDCASQPIPGVLIYITAVGASDACGPLTFRVACRVTDNSGAYTYAAPQDPNTVKYFVIAVPEGDGYGGCTGCSKGKCCGGSPPITTSGSATVPANANNQSYTVDINLSYSGSCDAGNGGSISNLSSIDCTTSSIQLSWSAPSDSGCRVVSYDIRYSTAEITEGNWSSATQLSGEPTPIDSGQTQSYWAAVPNSCTWYYFAVKAELRSGSYSAVSNLHHARTKCPPSSICATGE